MIFKKLDGNISNKPYQKDHTNFQQISIKSDFVIALKLHNCTNFATKKF